MRYLLVLLLALSVFFQANAAGNEGVYWQKANTFFEQKQYDSAAYYYRQIAQKNPHNAHVYYNLGNAYYRLNLIAPAVLNYEKALHINPSYKEAEDNLALTQARISNRIQPMQEIFFVQWWGKITSGSKAGLWAFITVVIFLLIIGLSLARTFRKINGVPVQVFIALIAVNVLSLVLAISSAANMADSHKGVVMQNDAPMYASPSQQGKASSLVPEGTTVEITGNKTTWVEIKLPDGRMGWIEQEMISPI
jgi:tetratricopeptide (TPR) repeat protein